LGKNKTIMPEKLSFGILCNSLMLEQWQVDVIDQLRNHGVELKLIVVKAPGPGSQAGSGIRSKTDKLFTHKALFYFFDRRLFHPVSKKIIDYSIKSAGIQKLSCLVVKIKYRSLFQEQDLDKIRKAKLDFLLRFGFGIIGGEVLHVPRYGIWSFHHGDEMQYRGGPPGLWEILTGNPVSGAMVQRLTEHLDKGYILWKGWFKTQHHSYQEQLDQLYFQSTHGPLQVCIAIQNGTYSETLSESNAPIYRVPHNRIYARFLVKLFWNRILFHYRKLFKTEDWNIGIIRKSIQNVIQSGWKPEEVQWFPKPVRFKYIADPFILQTDGICRIYFEYFCYKKRKGDLFSIETETVRNFPQGITQSLQLTNHASFPFVFFQAGESFMIPETHLDNRIALYRLNHDHKRFEYQCTLVDHVAGVDPVLCFHDNLWWLFFTRKELPSVHLYIYYSETLTGPYKPHLNNPVKSDIRSSRPAGALFSLNGMLMRPAQDCSAHYGRRIILNRITSLSPVDFREIEHTPIEPRGDYYAKGLHTLNGNQSITVIDGKEFRFICSDFLHELSRLIIRKR